MSKVFIGGSRRISRLNEAIRVRLQRIIDAELGVIIGDANGADKAAQSYFESNHYSFVEIFCAGTACRNNVGHWPTRIIDAKGLKGFDFYAAKDRAMADEATYGLMIWDGESVGTLMNVVRLLGQKKPAAVYVGPVREFVDLRNSEDFRHFLSDFASEVQNELETKAAFELKLMHKQTQANLF